MELAGDPGRGRGVVDGDGALAERAEGAVRPERHVAEVVVVADAGEDEVGAFRRRGGRRRRSPAEPRHPGFGLGAGAVEHDDVVAPARLEMAGHGKAHHAEPDPGDFAHWVTR